MGGRRAGYIAAVKLPEDDKFVYTITRHTVPERVADSARQRIFSALVSTAEKFGFDLKQED